AHHYKEHLLRWPEHQFQSSACFTHESGSIHRRRWRVHESRAITGVRHDKRRLRLVSLQSSAAPVIRQFSPSKPRTVTKMRIFCELRDLAMRIFPNVQKVGQAYLEGVWSKHENYRS